MPARACILAINLLTKAEQNNAKLEVSTCNNTDKRNLVRIPLLHDENLCRVRLSESFAIAFFTGSRTLVYAT